MKSSNAGTHFSNVLTIDDVIDSTVIHVNDFPRPIPTPVPIPIHQQGLIPNIDNYMGISNFFSPKQHDRIIFSEI